MKRITKLCGLVMMLTFCLMLVPQKAQAATSGFFEYEIKNDEAKLTKYNGAETSVKIPAKLGGKPVTCIDSSAFYDNDFIETVYIPDCVDRIICVAFDSCDNLKSVTGCKGITWLDYDVFCDCTSLTSYPLTSNLKTIGNGAFKNTAITTVVFPTTLEEIGAYAYEDCDNLTELKIPDGVELGDEAFSHCDGLKKVVLGNIDEYGGYLFYKCDNLETVEISNGVRHIDHGIFKECVSLKNVKLPNTVREIGYDSFYGCKSLTSLTIPYGVLKIKSDALRFSGLKTLVLPSSINYFESDVLYGTHLDLIQVPMGVTEFNPDISSTSSIGKIRCFKGSAAEQFALSEHIPIEYMTSIPATKISFDKSTVYMMEDDFVALNWTMAPTNTTDAMTWKSSSESIATVNGMGEVTANRAGSCTIVVTTSSGVLARINVVVNNKPSSVEFSKKSVEILEGNSFTLRATVKDKQGVRNDIIPEYASSNTSVATVDRNGKVTAIGKGKVTITAKIYGKKAQYEITVYDKLDKVSCRSITGSKKSLKIMWKQVPVATGYEVQYSTSSKFKRAKIKKVKASTTLATIKKLKSGKKYYVRVRATGKSNGKKVTGAWSKKRTVKVK